MSGSVNKVILIGRLGRDPETRTMQSGDKVVSFSLATSESWRDKATGERKEKSEWHNVVVFNDALAKIAEQYLKKGSECYVEGQLQTRKFTDKDGNERQTTEVVLQRFRGELTLLGGKPDGAAHVRPAQSGREKYVAAKTGNNGGAISAQIDDQIPFARFDTP